MEKLVLQYPQSQAETVIYFDKGLSQLAKECQGRRGALIMDEAVALLHGKQILAKLPSGFELLSFPSGEAAKTRETKQILEDELLKRKLGRDSIIAAAGGGVTTDLAGYLAATYMRGVPLLLIPTTLLGMADAAIGGKNGVNTPFGKNLIGTTYQPRALFIDLDLLRTLPAREWINGLAEILKYGLISKEPIWTLCETHDWKANLPQLLRDSILAKAEVVQQDPFEKGLRRILNFGHTVGHALEHLSHYEMAHGEAVSTGCMAESYLSHLLGYLSKAELDRILALYKRLGIAPRLPKHFSKSAFLEALSLDKKAKETEARFVLIDRIGRALPFEGAYCRPIPPKDLDSLLSWLANLS